MDREPLAGYASGPGASDRARAQALERLGDAASLVLVEGVSDQIAVETAAVVRGRDLAAERVVVVPIGGAHAIGSFLTGLGAPATALGVTALCDRREEAIVARGLLTPRPGLRPLGLHVCVEDLEDELIRAVGTPTVEAVFDAQGDLASFRSMREQPAWRGREPAAQMRRFLGSGARRKLRYARLLVEAAADLDRLPRPLDDVLAAVRPGATPG